MRTSVATILLLSSILAHSSCFILPRIVVLRNKQRLVSTTATMAKSKGPKVYAVAKGRKPGIYNTWGECQAQTSGFSGAIFKSFKARHEAEAFIQANSSNSRSSSVSSVAAAASSVASSTTTGASNQGRKRSRDNTNTVSVAASQQKKICNHAKSTANSQLQITIHFDGGSRGNPGLAGAGAQVVVTTNNSKSTPSTITYLVREYCGQRETNNYAEYKGLLAGLKQAKLCIEQYTAKKTISSSSEPLFNLKVYGDSNLIVQQLRGAWQCKNPNIKPLFHQSQQLIGEMKQLDAKSMVSFEHIYREQNKIADKLANEAMDTRTTWTTSTSDEANDDDSNDDDDMKQPAKRGKCSATSSKQEVIDVDDSDNDSHYSC